MLTQTRRHSFLVKLVILEVVLAVNKMDLVDWSKDRFDEIVADYAAFAKSIGIDDFTAIPISGLDGDNIAAPGEHSPWFHGPSLLPYLETVEIDADKQAAGPLRLPVQWVSRPNLDFAASPARSRAARCARATPSACCRRAAPAQFRASSPPTATWTRPWPASPVTLALADEIDCSRGDVIAQADDPPEVADQFETTLVWMADEPLLPGRPDG